MSFWIEHVIITIEEPKPIRGATKLAIISCTLPLPIKLVEIHVINVKTQVKTLEEPVIPKPIPFVIPNIGVSTKVTLIDTVTHASKVFKTPNTILKDTPIVKKPGFQLVNLIERVDTRGEQHIDDLITIVK
jgi:hypothetical protein